MNERGKEEEAKPEAVKPDGRAGVMAIVSLVLGIVSILCCWIPFFNFLLGAAAVILGILELKNIKNGISGENGRVMAIIGIVLGGIIVFWGILSLFTMGIASLINIPRICSNWY